jgi:hypothetical protein
LRDYHGGALVSSRQQNVAANPGETTAALLRRAASLAAAAIEQGLGTPQAAANNQPGSLVAVLPITSLDDWVHARDRLDRVPQIKKLALVALSRQQATVEINFVGGLDLLKAGLSQINLELLGSAPLWRLAPSAPVSTQ